MTRVAMAAVMALTTAAAVACSDDSQSSPTPPDGAPPQLEGDEIFRVAAATMTPALALYIAEDRVLFVDFSANPAGDERGSVALSSAGAQAYDAASELAFDSGVDGRSCIPVDGADIILTVRRADETRQVRYCLLDDPPTGVESLDGFLDGVLCAISGLNPDAAGHFDAVDIADDLAWIGCARSSAPATSGTLGPR